MDHESFDRLARAMGALGTRRGALGALLGAGVAAAAGTAGAARKDRNKKNKKRKGRKKGRAQVSAQAADCSSPGPSSNMNGCDFGGDAFGGGEDFSGQNLSSSSMVGTIFRNALLVGTNLSSSNMRGANFRGANLCGADLSSSVLRNADFRGFAPLGRPTNLTLADLSSSGGCGTILTNQFTIICGTIWCDGTVRNDSCPGGPPPSCGAQVCGGGFCAADECCAAGDCADGGTWEQCGGDGVTCAACADGEVCAADSASCEACAGQAGATACTPFAEARCAVNCACTEKATGGSVCWGSASCSHSVFNCNSDADCPSGRVCILSGACFPCFGGTMCAVPCQAAPATRSAGPSDGPRVEVRD